ncbi:hypothetical protein DOY81_000987 [Sarcophaga bullata]|nr:hypothetical protein DOY81_000987 [Sarcophaga bullata]
MENLDNTVYHTSAEQKLKSKNFAKLYRSGTPKIRDLLREKCRIRMKHARQQGFAHNRPDSVEPRKFDLKELFRRELTDISELDCDIKLQEEMCEELETELNWWFIDQLVGEESYLFDSADSQDLVCPICQLSNLVIYPTNEDYINCRCKCNANFNYTADLDFLRRELHYHFGEHELGCVNKMTFFVNPLTKQLEGMCEYCDYFCSL